MRPQPTNSFAYLIPGIKVRNYTEHDLIKDVSDYFKMPVEVLKSRSRKHEIVRARYIAIYFMVQLFIKKYSYETIGQFVGGYDHATVTHSLKTLKNLMQTNPKVKREVDDVLKKINEHIYKNHELKNIEKSLVN